MFWKLIRSLVATLALCSPTLAETAASIPAKFGITWGSSAGPSYIRAIPTLSQIGIQAGAASLQTGFPPVTFLPTNAGGTPPFGQDFNGIFNQITAWNQWQQMGGPVPYDSGFQTSIGGYPKGAVIASATFGQFWLSTADNNLNNPDTGGGNWVRLTMSSPTPGFTNLIGSAPGSAKTASWTVESITALTAVGGVPYSYQGSGLLSLSFNGAATGAGGMDTGSTPASLDLSIYAIYNPTTTTWSTLGTFGSTSNGTIYSGSNMPSGYTASILIYTSPTDSSHNLLDMVQQNRTIWTQPIGNFNNISGGAGNTYASIGTLVGYVPVNAKTAFPDAVPSTGTGSTNLYLSPTATEGPGRSVTWSGTTFNESTLQPIPILSNYRVYARITGGQSWNISFAGWTF